MKPKHILLSLATLLLTSTLAKPALAQLRGPTNQLLIPAAGAIPGANGTFFRSDITLVNYRDVEQSVALQWLPFNTSGTSGSTRFITIPARSGLTSEDFVTVYLNQTGLGSILVTGVSSTGVPDSAALLYATARIWSPQPDKSTGTVSQTFPVIPTGALNAAPQVSILGHHIDSRYRTNVGIVNLDPASSHTFDIVQSTDNPTLLPVQTTITVPPMSMVQVGLQNQTVTALQVVVTPRAPIDSRSWVAYGSSVDNVTGDSWSSLAFPMLSQ